MERFIAVRVLTVLVVCFLGAGQAVFGQGFGVYEQGACAMGRGGAAVAAPCADASGVFFNPAGLSFDTTQVGLGGALIGPRGDFADTATQAISTLNAKWYPAPNIYASRPLTKKVAVGLGVFAPYGLTTDWPEASQGRFLGYKSVVQGVYIQPTVAVKINDRLSVGGGLDVTYLRVQLRQRVDLSSQALTPTLTFANLGVLPGTDFADVNLEGDTIAMGYHVGVLLKANERVSFGARYLSEQSVEIEDGTITTQQISAVRPNGTQYVLPVSLPGVAPAGTPLDLLVQGQFQAGGKLSNQGAATTIPMPAQFVVGTAVKVAPRVLLLADYQFTGWSAFDRLPIDGELLKSEIVENYKDTHGIRLGAEFSLGAKTVLRAGFDGHGAAAPDESVTPNLPEGSRQEYTVGLGHQLTPRMRLDVAYMRLQQPERAGRTGHGSNNGVYNFNANLFGMMLAFGF